MFPRMPYNMRKAERQITRFLGLNLTENTKEGEFADTYGVTTAKYPCLSQRDSRRAVEGYINPTDVFEWDGKLCVVDGGELYWNGDRLDEVSDGRKQFAVLSDRIVVFPDRVCIHTEDGSYHYLGASVTTTDVAGSAVFTENSITAALHPIVKTSTSSRYRNGISKTKNGIEDTLKVLYTYGSDVAVVYDHWNKNKSFAGLPATLKAVHSMVPSFVTIPEAGVGDIILLKKEGTKFSLVTGVATVSGAEADGEPLPDTSLQNDEGYFGVLSSLAIGEYTNWGNGNYAVDTQWRFDVYDANREGALFSLFFSVGDYVDIRGTKNGANNKTHLQILGIDDETNTLTFADGSFTASSETAVTIEVPFPTLDYICESGNRLWGVSNKDNTVYVSALGKPNDFYSYDTEDSYAVVLGSDGEFTAICAYGDSVLCWKEDILHKFYGDMPSNYRCTDVKIAGVQKGSDRSIAVIDEKLYYKGVFGVYVYSGGIPQKISYNLGEKLLADAVGGGYRDRYYMSALDALGKPHLLVYDITHGLWMQEDKLYAEAFARVGTALYMLSDGVLYECGAGDEQVEWMAEFVPFTETAHNRKGYAMLRLRLDMGARSHLRVETRYDRGPWREVFSKSATDAMTVNVPLKLGRCDRFSVRLSGRGECVIRSLEREFFVGSKR